MNFVLSDSNILLRAAQPSQPSHPMYQEALDAQDELRKQGIRLCIVAQNIVEFRAVATRPITVNGLGMSQQEADAEIVRLKRIYRLFLDNTRIFAQWEQLVRLHGAGGKQNHDAHLVASMKVHGIGTILTFNRDDFVRYPDIKVLTPQEVLAANIP